MAKTSIVSLSQGCAAADLMGYAQLLPQLAPGRDPALIANQLERCLRQSQGHILIAKQQAVVCGGLCWWWYDHALGRRAWIEDVVVDAAMRRQGIARALLDTALKQVWSADVDICQLSSHPRRVAAQETYQALGWQPSGSVLYRRDRASTTLHHKV